jgi:hypothetical protein
VGKSKSRKIKTPRELIDEAEQRMRLSLIETGIPAHRVAGAGVRAFASEHVPNMRGLKVIRSLHATTVDRWLAEGGPGFEEPQRRAIDRVRGLWHVMGTSGKLVANLDGVGGSGGMERGIAQADAMAAVAQYQDRLGIPYAWEAFENVVRWDMPAGAAGSHLANNSPQQQAHAKACVGLVASMIAQWERY